MQHQPHRFIPGIGGAVTISKPCFLEMAIYGVDQSLNGGGGRCGHRRGRGAMSGHTVSRLSLMLLKSSVFAEKVVVVLAVPGAAAGVVGALPALLISQCKLVAESELASASSRVMVPWL